MSYSIENGAIEAIPYFDEHWERATIGPRWTVLLTSFELFAYGKGLIINETSKTTTKEQRLGKLLHFSGPDVQEHDFLNTCGYSRCVKQQINSTVIALKGYFLPKVNFLFVHQQRHRIHQKEGESIWQLY